MTIQELKSIIAGDETKTLELKKTTGELKDAMHAACAFLNTDGGWLIFGIAPTSLKILGQDVTDNTQRELSQALSGLEPAVTVDVEYVDVPEQAGKKVIAIHFDAFVWGHTPFTYLGRPYYRVESTTKAMPRDMYDERLRANRPQYFAWERQKADGFTTADLDEERIRGTLRLGSESGRVPTTSLTEPITKVLEKLELLTDGVPNNAAVMLFGNKITGYPQLRMRMARFLGNNKMEFIDNQRAEGNFFELLDAGMAFFFKHLSLSGKITGVMREEHLEIPVAALREALVNALCHRQYEKFNLTIGIAIYDDRIEIESPGIFPPQITPENIKEPHGSFPYNPIIANVLFKTTFLENWGSGASRIITACEKQNIPAPTWTTDGGFVRIAFLRPQKQLDPSSTPQVPPKYTPSTPQVQKLIGGMGEFYMSLKDMLNVLGFKDRKTFRESYLTPALSEGAIEQKYPDSPHHPRQMYRLTAKAIEWLKSNQNK